MSTTSGRRAAASAAARSPSSASPRRRCVRRREDRAQRGAHDRVVVGDQHADGHERAPAGEPSLASRSAPARPRTVPPTRLRAARHALQAAPAAAARADRRLDALTNVDLHRVVVPRDGQLRRAARTVLPRVRERLLDDPVCRSVTSCATGPGRSPVTCTASQAERRRRRCASSRSAPRPVPARRRRRLAVEHAEHPVELAHGAPAGVLDADQRLSRGVDVPPASSTARPGTGLEEHRGDAVAHRVVELEGERRAVPGDGLAGPQVLLRFELLEPSLRLEPELLARAQECAEQPGAEVGEGDHDQRHGSRVAAREDAEGRRSRPPPSRGPAPTAAAAPAPPG